MVGRVTHDSAYGGLGCLGRPLRRLPARSEEMAIQLRQRGNAAQFIERGYNLLPLSYPALHGHIRSPDRFMALPYHYGWAVSTGGSRIHRAIVLGRRAENFCFSAHFLSFSATPAYRLGSCGAPGLGLTGHSGIMSGIRCRSWQGASVTARIPGMKTEAMEQPAPEPSFSSRWRGKLQPSNRGGPRYDWLAAKYL